MGTNEDEIAFFREGLSRYPIARETVEYFEKSVLDAIFNAFQGKSDWKHFQPILKNDSLEFGKGIGIIYINAWIAGAISSRNIQKALLGLGVYWSPPLLKGSMQAVAACYCTSMEGSPVRFHGVKLNERVKLGRLFKKTEEPRFMLKADVAFDPHESFGVLLEAADAALGKTEALERP